MDMHPDYGLTDDVRLTILKDAEALGVKRAAQAHRVSETVIYNWRKRLEVIDGKRIMVR